MSYAIDELEKNYIQSIKMGQSGYPYIISPKGIFVAHSGQQPGAAGPQRNPGIRDMLGAPGQGVSFQRNGVDKMLAWYTVPYWNWKVALVMDTAEIQAPAGNSATLCWAG